MNTDVKEFYNKNVSSYAKSHTGSSISKKELDIFIKELKARGGLRVLDVGSGLGQETEYLFPKGCQALGIDVSGGMTKYAWKHRKHGLFLTFDFFEFYKFVGGNYFDGLWVSSSILTHIDKKDAGKFFVEARKLLKQRGLLGIIVRKDAFKSQLKIPFNNYSKKEITSLVAENGFKLLYMSEKKFKESKWWFVLGEKVS